MLKNKVIKYKKLYQLSLIFLLLFLPLLLLALIRETNIRSNAFSSSLETENGSLSGNASVQTDPLASGGKYVEFGKTVSILPPVTPLAFSQIRGVTLYGQPTIEPNRESMIPYLQKELPLIKKNGFNTIWFVTPWAEYNPKPLANPPVYNETSFANLKKTLDLLRANNMHVFMGLNYLGSGWEPEGISACSYQTDPVQYKAFVRFTNEFLGRLQNYSDMIYPLVFMETALLCSKTPWDFNEATRIVNTFRSTLGRLPLDLDPQIRAKYKIGYHDLEMVFSDWARGQSPLPTPNPYDFVSFSGYEMEQKTNQQIGQEVNLRAGRMKKVFPGKPLIMGEMGVDMYKYGVPTGARVLPAIVSEDLKNQYGFNIWTWNASGLGLTDENGNPNQAALVLKQILNP